MALVNPDRQLSKANVALPATMWTDIVKWRETEAEARSVTLERFYSRYRLPLITVLRHMGFELSDAEDVLHDFILAQVEGGIMLSADPTKGRFRNLLLTSLKRFVVSRHRRARAAKRCPKGGFEYLDAEVIDGRPLKDFIAASCTPDEIFHRAWLLSIFAQVRSRLREEFEAKGQLRHLAVFERRILQPIMNGAEAPSITRLAEDLGISPAEASNHLVTAKRAYRRLLILEIQEYLGTEKEVNQEINEIRYFLANLHH